MREWSPWAKLDPEAKYTSEGPEEGVGAKISWDGKQVGKGSQCQEIKEALVQPRQKPTATLNSESGRS